MVDVPEAGVRSLEVLRQGFHLRSVLLGLGVGAGGEVGGAAVLNELDGQEFCRAAASGRSFSARLTERSGRLACGIWLAQV